MSKLTVKRSSQRGKILEFMLFNPEKWYRPEDFMQYGIGEYFVGYEAHARLSELYNHTDFVDAVLRTVADPMFEPKTYGQRQMKVYRITKLGLDLVREWKK